MYLQKKKQRVQILSLHKVLKDLLTLHRTESIPAHFGEHEHILKYIVSQSLSTVSF